MKWILFVFLSVIIGCSTNYVQDVVTIDGAIIDIDSARFEFPDSAVMDSLIVDIEKHSIPQKIYAQGYRTTGTAYTIAPFELDIDKPVEFSVPVKSSELMLGAKIAQGFVPLASSYVDGETLRAKLWHGGEYYVIQRPEKYGIIEHADADSALLIVTDPYVSDYVDRFTATLVQQGYKYPVWIFVNDPDRSIEENAFFLKEELSRLHELYDDFRLDIVSFGVGGLVFHRYVADTVLYQRDISSSVLAVGTPFKGSDLVTPVIMKEAHSAYRYFYIDGFADHVEDIDPESDFMGWVSEHRNIVGGHYYNSLEENKNFASIRGRAIHGGRIAEECEGDGLVSLSSGMLTAIEPEPLPLDHFNLYEDRIAHEYTVDFTALYHTFNWPSLFDKVWRDEVSMNTVTDVWEHEARLNYGETGVELLLQWNENMLNSTPEHAILITNGDNDTYPAWYLQKKGVRQDITIVNRNLLNIKDYALYLQRHKSLPLDLTAEELENITFKKEKGTFVTISDQLIKVLIGNHEQPLVFSTTVYNPEAFGCPLMLAGVVYEIRKGDIEVEGKYVDINKTWALFKNTFKFDKFLDGGSTSIPIQNMYRNYTGALNVLFMAFDMEKDYDRAIEVLRFAQTLCPDEEARVFVDCNLAFAHAKYGSRDAADSLFRLILAIPSAPITFRKRIGKVYYEWGQTEKAIKILADCLKEEPGNKEVLDLIKKYQEDL